MRRGVRDQLTPRQLITLDRVGIASAAVEPPERFKLPVNVGRDRYTQPQVNDEQLPNWIRALLERHAPFEELLSELKRRLLRAPTEDNLQLGLALVNEIARTAEGARLVHEFFDEETISILTSPVPDAHKLAHDNGGRSK